MGLEFDHVDAWTMFVEGDPETAGRAAAAHAIGNAQRPVPKRQAAAIESTMVDLARARDEFDAHDFFALTSDAPIVEVLAYTIVRYERGPDAAERAVDDSLAALPNRTGTPDVSTPSTGLGTATRILDHVDLPPASRWGRPRPATFIRWVQPIPQLTDPVTAVLTTVIPRRTHESFVAPLVDQFAMGLVVTPEGA